MNRFLFFVVGLTLGAIEPTVILAADSKPKPVQSTGAQQVMVAPFGLEWGISKKEIEGRGVKLNQAPSSERSQRFTATGLSKLVAGVETVLLDFGFDDKLWKVIAVGEDYPNDPYGFKVKTRYAELSNLLAEKYGKGAATHSIGDSFYGKAENFLYGIMNGKLWHFTTYNHDGVNIELSVRAKSSDAGYWVLIYNNVDLEKEFEKAKANHEKGAL